MFTSMWAKIKSNLNTNINEHKVRYGRKHIKFTTAYLKAMGLEERLSLKIFSNMSLLLDLAVSIMPFTFKKQIMHFTFLVRNTQIDSRKMMSKSKKLV